MHTVARASFAHGRGHVVVASMRGRRWRTARTLSLPIRITVPYLWTYTHAAGANSKGWGSIQGLRGSEATTIFGTPPESLVLG